MASRDTQASLAAGYQLMASYLVWDLRDLLSEGRLISRDARERLRQFIEMLLAAKRAARPAYPATPAEQRSGGNARAERSKRLTSLSRDEQLFDLIIAARGDRDPERASTWAEEAWSVLEAVQKDGWRKPADQARQRFIEDDVEDFLRRLQRIDQLDGYRPVRRQRLNRR
jgi:hypothetical protein